MTNTYSVNTLVNTVRGRKRVSELGKTLTHEHLALDFSEFYVTPPTHLKKHLNDFNDRYNPLLSSIAYIRQYPYSNLYNLRFHDSSTNSAIYTDAQKFKDAGGQTIVENTSHGLKRNITLMKSVSQNSEINVIAGTGYYVASTQDASTLKMTKEEMYNLMRKELKEGCVECPDVKAGFIGEVGSSWPINDFEKRSICATGELQAQLRCSVSFHPGRYTSAPMEILRIYQEAGGNASKAIMSHIDRTVTKKEQLMEFTDNTKCYIQFDLFGTECSYYQLNPSIDMLSDAQRIERIAWLKKEGKLDRVLMSHNIHTKHRLTHFGGHGYSHILDNVVPTMINKGFSLREIDTIMIKNPKRWLTRG